MIVNKSMFPLQTGFGVISKMQGKFATLQMQLGTGEKASNLAEMGRDLPMSLSVRQRLSKIEGFTANIETVNLRLSFLDKTMSRFDKLEAEARSSAVQGQYGTNNVNMAMLPSLSHARLDELVTLLNSDVAGRYLFGGSNTDSAPLPDTKALLEGLGGKAGFKAVVTERQKADAGADGLGRLDSVIDPATPNTFTLSEDGDHPFGFKVSTVSSSGTGITVTTQPQPIPQPIPGGPYLGDQVSVTFNDPLAVQEGDTITVGLTLPDGTETQIAMRAVTAANATGSPGEFVIGLDANETTANFQTAFNAKLANVAESELSAASTFAASKNFFNGPGEPVLRVDGDPATATGLKVATDADTVLWYKGQSPAVSASNMGRLEIGSDTATNTVTLGQQKPVSSQHGFSIAGVSGNTTNITTNLAAGALGVQFGAAPVAGEAVKITLAGPDGTQREVTLTAVQGRAGPGQFTIGTDAASTAANFAKSLNASVTEAAAAAEGNPRQSVTAQVDDSTRVSYGMQANESGFLRLVRTMASMSVTSYTDSPEGRQKFDAMANRQQSEMSEAHNSEHGSIEILTMELGVAHGTLQSSTQRHTAYKAQLDNLLSDIETVSKEDVAMELLALQTRLQASYQATSMVSKLSLVNFL